MRGIITSSNTRSKCLPLLKAFKASSPFRADVMSYFRALRWLLSTCWLMGSSSTTRMCTGASLVRISISAAPFFSCSTASGSFFPMSVETVSSCTFCTSLSKLRRVPLLSLFLDTSTFCTGSSPSLADLRRLKKNFDP